MSVCVKWRGAARAPPHNAPYGDPMERRGKERHRWPESDTLSDSQSHSKQLLKACYSRAKRSALRWRRPGMRPNLTHSHTHTLLIIHSLLFTDRHLLQRHSLLLAALHLCVCEPGPELQPGREGGRVVRQLPSLPWPASSYRVSVMAPSLAPFHSELLHVAHSLQTTLPFSFSSSSTQTSHRVVTKATVV